MHPRLMRGVSAGALIVVLVSTPVLAQQSLPTIDVGAARRAAAAARAPVRIAAPARVASPAPAEPQQPGPVPLSQRDAPRVPSAAQPNIPSTVATLSRAQLQKTTNSLTTMGMFKYLPSIQIRERFIGDRNGILSTRTAGTIASAQTMVFADNVLLSNFLGNSFGFPPRWAMVSPAEIERVDVMYGPFSAAYPGNSIGGVLTMTTRMPENFEVHYQGDGAFQNFRLYQANERNLSGHMNLLIGNKINDLRFWVGYDWLDARGQSASYTAANSDFFRAGAPGVPIVGGHFDLDPQGKPRFITALTSRDHSQQHMAKIRLDYEFAPHVHANYWAGLWSFVSDSDVTPFARRADNGATFYNTPNFGAPIPSAQRCPFAQPNRVTTGGLNVCMPATNPSHATATHLMQVFTVKKNEGGVFDFDVTGLSYNFLRDYSHNATRFGIAPGGQNTVNTGTYWRTLDARGIWRPDWDMFGRHEVSLGGHWDVYSLALTQTNTLAYTSPFWAPIRVTGTPIGDVNYGINTINTGKTSTKGIYIQDAWRFHPDWKLTVGGRGDFWEAYNGMNQGLTARNDFGVTGAPTFYSNRYKQSFSPSGGLEWQATKELLLRFAVGRAYRYPTVNELFRNVTTATAITIANPDLQPEISTSYELTGQYTIENLWGVIGWARPRVTLFMDDRWNTIANLVDPILRTNANVNIDKVHFNGVEGAFDTKDFLTEGLDVNGALTITDSRTVSNWRDPLIVGKQFLRIPRVRLRGFATYTPPSLQDLTLSTGVRFQTAAYNTLDNSDWNREVYGTGSSAFLLFDAKASYKVAPEWTLSAGIDNIGNYKSYAFHPYPQRTYYLSLRYDLGDSTSKVAAPFSWRQN